MLLSSSAKTIKNSPLPEDYYNFKMIYLYSSKSMKTEMLALMGMALSMFCVYKYNTSYMRREKNKDLHGTDRWLTLKELRKKPLEKDIYFVKKNNISYGEKSGIILCENDKGYFVDTSTTHSLIVGTTRSGKGQTFFLPMIRMLSSTKMKQSMVINDPKGELLENSYTNLKKNGYKIIVLNLRDTNISSRWNPLSEIIRQYKKARANQNQDFSKTSELIGDLAKVFTDNPHSDPFWTTSAKSLLSAMIFYLLEQGYNNNCLDKLNMYSVYNFFLEFGSKNEQKVVNQMQVNINALDELFKALPVGNPAKLAYATSNFSAGDTRASIFTTLSNNIEIFADNGIALLTSGEDICFDDLINSTKPCALFMVVPDEKTNRHILASLFISQCYSQLVDIANTFPRQISPQRIQFILDEFGNMVRIPDMDTKLTVALGRNIIFNLFVQDLNQLTTRYDKAATTIQSSCNNFIYINSIDKTTNEYVSAILGTTTREYSTYSGKLNETWNSENINYNSRPLLNSTEVEKLEFGEALVKRQRVYPLRTKFTPFFTLGIPITPIAEIPLQTNNIKLSDILFPLNVISAEKVEQKTQVNKQDYDLSLAIDIADKHSNGYFGTFVDDKDYAQAKKLLNFLRYGRKITTETYHCLNTKLKNL